MPLNSFRGGNHRGRGRGRGARSGGRGGARGGGPRLPSALTDELGLPSQKKKEHRETERTERPRFREREHAARNPSQDLKRKRPDQLEEQLMVSVRKSLPNSDASLDAKPLSGGEHAYNVTFINSNTTARKKLNSSASTPLSRILAGQKSRHTSANDLDEVVEEETEGVPRKKIRVVDETPLDPSIMDKSGLGGGKGKKAEKDEDDEIAWLEWKLGGKGKHKSKKQSVPDAAIDESDDGLDDLWNFADGIAFGKLKKKKNGKVAPSHSEEEGSDYSMEFSEQDEMSLDGQEDDDSDVDLDDFGSEGEDEEDLHQFWTDEECNNDTDEELARNTAMNARPAEKKQTDDETRVTISAPSTLSMPPAGTKYIPPSLRKAQPSSSAIPVVNASPHATHEPNGPSSLEAEVLPKTEQQIKLERKVKGLLNKLSEANIESILADVEGLFREWSRHDVTTTLTDMIIHIISDRANLNDSFVILYAAFVSGLYKLKGADLGGHFLQTAITRFATTVNAGSSSAVNTDTSKEQDHGKQPLNILTLIAELYNFQVVGCLLIYDLIKRFIDDLTAGGDTGNFAVEGILRILRCSGSQLRSDDPTALKDIVALVQVKVTGSESGLSPRAKFMIETLTNIKNNKVKNLPGGQGQIANETMIKMKKFLGGLGKKRQVVSNEPLRVTLADIQTASTRGKWWIVGAAWSGDPVRERERARLAALESAKKKNLSKPSSLRLPMQSDGEDETDLIGLETGQHEALLKLARKQGMNTDVRRQIFMVMMTSDDYTHACDRLAGLKFTEVQQREFIRVAVHCLAIEDPYNPYYPLLLSHQISSSYSHRFTLQYALWDFLRDLGQEEVGGEGTRGDVRGTSGFGVTESDGKKGVSKVRRVGMGIGWVLSQGGVDLTVFKPVDFTSLQPSTKSFFSAVFTFLILGLHTQSPAFKLTAKGKRRAEPYTLKEDDSETIEAIFVKTLSAGGMELPQGIRWFLAKEMGISDGSKGGGTNQGRSKLSKVAKELGIIDSGLVEVVRDGLTKAEQVLGRMM